MIDISLRSRIPGFVFTACLLFLSTVHGYASGLEIYFIDAHSQVDHEVADLGLILERMNEAGVARTILSARPGRRPSETSAFALHKAIEQSLPFVIHIEFASLDTTARRRFMGGDDDLDWRRAFV